MSEPNTQITSGEGEGEKTLVYERPERMRLRDNPTMVGPVSGRGQNYITIQVPTIDDITRTPDAFEPVPSGPPLTEDDQFILETASHHGFECIDDEATIYSATDDQIISLVRAARKQGYDDALAAPAAKGGTEPTPAAIEQMAEHLLEEDHEAGWTWPTHRDDDGYRGGGYVTIVPPDVQAHLRDKAKRVLIRAAQIAADPRAASPPPPAGAAGGGSGDLAALSAGATQGPWQVRQLLSDKGSEYLECFITDERSNLATDVDRAEADFIVALVNAYRSGRLVEASAPTPDLGAQGEPVAWAYEWNSNDGWEPRVSLDEVKPRDWIRNIRPLYEAPAAPRSGSGVSVEGIKEKAAQLREEAKACEDVGSYTGADQANAVAAAYEEVLALLQAPRPDETGDEIADIEKLRRLCGLLDDLCAWDHSKNLLAAVKTLETPR